MKKLLVMALLLALPAHAAAIQTAEKVEKSQETVTVNFYSDSADARLLELPAVPFVAGHEPKPDDRQGMIIVTTGAKGVSVTVRAMGGNKITHVAMLEAVKEITVIMPPNNQIAFVWDDQKGVWIKA